MLTVDRVRRADDCDRAQFRDAAPCFLDRALDVVHRDLRGEFEPHRVGLAVIGGPVVIGARQRRGVVGFQIVVAQHLPPARAVHDRDVDPLDIHRSQCRARIEAARPRHLEMRVAGAAAAAQLAARDGGAGLPGMRRDREPLDLHAHDVVGVALVVLAVVELRLMRTEEARRVLPIRFVEIARPQIVGLHHVEIAVHDQIAVACHGVPPRSD